MAIKDLDLNLVQDLHAKTQALIEEMAPFGVLVLGKTGVGKSTLINSLFRENLTQTGIGKPVTQKIQMIQKPGLPMRLFDSPGLELAPQSQLDFIQQIQELQAKVSQKDAEGIHLVYYCIQASSHRIEDLEVEVIKQAAQTWPVVLVLTQAYGHDVQDFVLALQAMDLPLHGIYPVLAQDYVLRGGKRVKSFGLDSLVMESLLLLPQEIAPAFVNAQQADLSLKTKAARKWVTRYVTMTFGVGFSPIPFSDASLLVPLQVSMMAQLTAIYGIALDKDMLTSLVSVVGGTSGATYLGRTISSNLLKLIPGAGTVLGGVISGSTAAMVTMSLGYAYIEVLTYVAKQKEAGKKLTPDQIKDLFQKKIQGQLSKEKWKDLGQKARQILLKKVKNNSSPQGQIDRK